MDGGTGRVLRLIFAVGSLATTLSFDGNRVAHSVQFLSGNAIRTTRQTVGPYMPAFDPSENAGPVDTKKLSHFLYGEVGAVMNLHLTYRMVPNAYSYSIIWPVASPRKKEIFGNFRGGLPN